MRIQFIDNDKHVHEDEIIRLFNGAKMLYISVAFLRTSGLDAIYGYIEKALEENCRMDFFVGVNFYLTEPKALHRLLSLFNNYQNAQLHLHDGKSVTFHPKVYCSVRAMPLSLAPHRVRL